MLLSLWMTLLLLIKDNMDNIVMYGFNYCANYVHNQNHAFTFKIQWKLSKTSSLGLIQFVLYINNLKYFVISVVNKRYKTKEIKSLGLEKLVCYIIIRSLYIEFPLYIDLLTSIFFLVHVQTTIILALHSVEGMF